MIKAIIYFTSGLNMEIVCSKKEVEQIKSLLHHPHKQGRVITLNEPNKPKTISICLDSIVAMVSEEFPEGKE